MIEFLGMAIASFHFGQMLFPDRFVTYREGRIAMRGLVWFIAMSAYASVEFGL